MEQFFAAHCNEISGSGVFIIVLIVSTPTGRGTSTES